MRDHPCLVVKSWRRQKISSEKTDQIVWDQTRWTAGLRLNLNLIGLKLHYNNNQRLFWVDCDFKADEAPFCLTGSRADVCCRFTAQQREWTSVQLCLSSTWIQHLLHGRRAGCDEADFSSDNKLCLWVGLQSRTAFLETVADAQWNSNYSTLIPLRLSHLYCCSLTSSHRLVWDQPLWLHKSPENQKSMPRLSK